MPRRGFDARLEPELAALAGYHPGKLAELARCHPRTLHREIHRLFGCSPREWLRRLRLQHVESLLLAGCWVKEAAGEAKFKDVSSFCRWFKAQRRFPPSEFASTTTAATTLSSAPEDWCI